MNEKHCPYCGTRVNEGDTFCTECGKVITAAQTAGNAQAAQNAQYAQSTQAAQNTPFPQNAPSAPNPPYPPQFDRGAQPPQAQYAAPVNVNYAPNYAPQITADQLPPQFRPLSPWAYFGYSLLFGIPVVGLVLLIVFSFSNANINRRNFARSFFCFLLIAAIIVLTLVLLGVIGQGVSSYRYR